MKPRFGGWMLLGPLLMFPATGQAYELLNDGIPAVAGFSASASHTGGVTACLPASGMAAGGGLEGFLGFWIPEAGQATGIGDPQAGPMVSRLNRAFPNPFRPQVTMEFQVAASDGGSTPARLRIYDVAGRVVRSIIDRPLAPGTYSVQWDGTDSRDQRVARGVYFARFTAGTYSKTVRLVKTN